MFHTVTVLFRISLLHSVLSQKRVFTEAGQYRPIARQLHGVMGFEDYRSLIDKDSLVDQLRQSGLSDDEVRLKLINDGVVLEHNMPVCLAVFLP